MTDQITKQFQFYAELLHDLYLLKKNQSNDFQAKRKMAVLLFASLKHCSRAIKYKMKAQRTELQTIKSAVDGKRMQLQNIFYEIDHLKNEIAQCNAVESNDSAIPLLTQEEYPDDACAETSEHSRHLYRLNCELSLRKKLADAHTALLLSKAALVGEIVEKIERHSNFMPAVNQVLNSTQALQDALHMSTDPEWKLGSEVQFLPKPLYILFMNISALQKISSDFIDCEVSGFQSEVRQLEDQIEDGLITEDTSPCTTDNDAKTSNLKPHNLHVKLMIGSSARKERLEICVRYFEQLGCVTAIGTLHNENHEELFSELRSPTGMLGGIFNGDSGDAISSVTVDCKLSELGLTQHECLKHLSEQGYGKPYRWVHRLCCISHVSSTATDQTNLKLHKFAQKVTNALRKRFLSWLQLGEQLQALAKNEMHLFTTPESCKLPIECNLAEWKSISTQDPEITRLSSELLSVDRDVPCDWFRATIVRSPAKMECLVRITSNYPIHQPLWFIAIHWNNKVQYTADIKMIEKWTNSLSLKELKNNESLLYAQLIRTMYSFDIFLETEATLCATPAFEKEKPFLRPFAKRFRMRPYKLCNKGSVLMFKP